MTSVSSIVLVLGISFATLACSGPLTTDEKSRVIDTNSLLGDDIAPEYFGEWVMCRSKGVNEIVETDPAKTQKGITKKKEKRCEPRELPWSTSKVDNPKATELYRWRDIIITVYDDNKTVRFTFDHKHSGWSLDKGQGYQIKVFPLDNNYTRLYYDGIPVNRTYYLPPPCRNTGWEEKVYEFQLTGSDQYKYDDTKHIVFTLTPIQGQRYRYC